MSRIDRALEKADREGLLTWTKPLDEQERAHSTLVETIDEGRGSAQEEGAAPDHEPRDFVGWDEPIEDTTMSPLFVAAVAPASSAAEQFRLLRTRLEARDAARRLQLLIVTSPRIGDGKTTTAANLALTMSQEFQQRVVLVEADLRRPTLADMFGVRREPGLVVGVDGRLRPLGRPLLHLALPAFHLERPVAAALAGDVELDHGLPVAGGLGVEPAGHGVEDVGARGHKSWISLEFSGSRWRVARCT